MCTEETKTMSRIPIDYLTYTAILDRAEIRKDARTLPTLEAALRSLVADEPTAAHVEAYRRYTGARAPVTKQAPARVAAPAVPQAPPPPPTATEALMAAIAKAQAAEPGLSFLAASDRVSQEHPDLHAQYVLEQRFPQRPVRPVAKQEALSTAAIMKMAEAHVRQQPGLTTRAALEALVTAHPHEPAFYTAYRMYHLGAGLDDHLQAPRAPGEGR